MEALAGRASTAFAAHDYPAAHSAAVAAYSVLRAVLRAQGVKVVGATKGFSLDGARAPVGNGPARLMATLDSIARPDSGKPMCLPVRASLQRAECGFPVQLAPLLR